jgi:hypothetical protein
MRDMRPRRQGDILLVPVEKVPEGLVDVPRENGRIVLAEGEETGHLHMIEAPEALFRAEDLDSIEGRFLEVEAEVATEHEVPIFETKVVGHYTEEEAQEIGSPDEVKAGDPITETVQVGTRTVKGVALTHPEHDTIVLEPGAFRVVRQREYTEAGGISLVAD